jgi:hypothetical protein
LRRHRLEAPGAHKRRYIVDRHFRHRLINSSALCLRPVFARQFLLRRLSAAVLRGSAPARSPPDVSPALLLFSIASVAAFGFVAFLLIAVYTSNQIAGPLYRTKQGLDRVGRGEYSFHLQFREGDFLRDVPVAFNNMLDSLRHQAETDLEELREIEAADADSSGWKALVRRQIERREAQLGLGPDPGGSSREPAPVSLTVH